MIGSLDHTNADLQEKIAFLKRLKEQYGLPASIYSEISKQLNYDSKMATTGLASFVDGLPPQLRIAVVMSIHENTFKRHSFFKGIMNRRLLTFLGQCFRHKYYEAG